MHECMVRLCILLNSLLYICKSELRKSQSGIKGFFFATAAVARCAQNATLLCEKPGAWCIHSYYIIYI